MEVLSFMSQLHTPMETASVHIGQDAEWVPELVWLSWRTEKSAPARNQTQIPQTSYLQPTHYNDNIWTLIRIINLI
jgi:hypothetical protein